MDLTALTHIDAAGFAAIAVAIRIGDSNHNATITCAPGHIRRLLNITLLDQEALVYETGTPVAGERQHPFDRAVAVVPKRRTIRSLQSRRSRQLHPNETTGNEMATQYDFTNNEWDHLASTPVLVGLAVAKAEDSGFVGSMKESRALVKQLAAKLDADNPAHGLITAAAGADTKPQTGAFKALAPATLADMAVTACTEVALHLARVTSTEEAAAFKAWIVSIGTRVAEAATEAGIRISPKEAALLERVTKALD